MTRHRISTSVKAVCVSILLASTLVSPVAAEDTGEDGWDFRWKDGFKLESADGHFKLAFGGRINLDVSFPDADAAVEALVGPIEDTNDIRRGRLGISGTVYERVEFKIEYDFAGGDADATDVYIGLQSTPVGNIRFGHFFEPFSLEQLTSSKYTTFVERALPNAFAPARNFGLMFSDTAMDKRMTWAIGAFRESDGFSRSEGDGMLNLTGRLTGLPIYEDGGRRLLHLGLSVSQKDVGDATFRYRQRPEAAFSPRLVDTGSFRGDSVDLVALEAAVNVGSFHAQGEYTQADVDNPVLGDPSFDGVYVQAGYFLTGEHRPYSQGRGSFSRVKPKSIFGKEGGSGAWEIAARYSTIDLSDAAIGGGELENFTLALNWYLNPVTRVLLNYVTADLQDVGDADFVLFRLHIDF